jgi:hypothetical protein
MAAIKLSRPGASPTRDAINAATAEQYLVHKVAALLPTKIY